MPIIEQAAAHFVTGAQSIQPLGNGLINRTYKVDTNGGAIVLQCINQSTFPQPENIIKNYLLIQEYAANAVGVKISALLKTIQGQYSWTDAGGNFWRATAFVPNSYASTHTRKCCCSIYGCQIFWRIYAIFKRVESRQAGNQSSPISTTWHSGTRSLKRP